jgi:hypothetical protein
MVYMPVTPGTWEAEARGLRELEDTLGKVRETLSQKQIRRGKGRTEGMAQVVDCLPNETKALGLIARNTKKKRKKYAKFLWQVARNFRQFLLKEPLPMWYLLYFVYWFQFEICYRISLRTHFLLLKKVDFYMLMEYPFIIKF